MMDEVQPPSRRARSGEETLLSFWALGDLHYYDHAAWQAIHAPRMSLMYRDLRQVWAQEGVPAFCVSPGDLVEKGEPEHYQLAREQLNLNLVGVPFYPGLGNHELFTGNQVSQEELLECFTIFWEKPSHYYWVEGEVLCVMLAPVGYGEPVLASESLAFLETALAKHPRHIALVFAHCPLAGTVLGRGPDGERDYTSLERFFSVGNSDDVRAIFARHTNACLYLSGHTHTGWPAPNVVVTEDTGGHPVTHVNLLSPWYTGRHHGIEWLDEQTCRYRPDDPDLVVSFSVRVSRAGINLRLRDHRARNWLAEWNVLIE